MAKLEYGAEPWILEGVGLLEIGEHEYVYGDVDEYGQVVRVIGQGFFKTAQSAHKKMVFDVSNDERSIKKANKLFSEYRKYQRDIAGL